MIPLIKIVRTIKYSNGKIEVSTSLQGIHLVAFRSNKIVATKGLSFEMLGNQQILDTMIGYLKNDAQLMLKSDDSVLVMSGGRRYTIRGSDWGLAVMYRQEDSNHYQNLLLPYDYNRLSLQDYYLLFPESK